jgi:hypothetical protein
MIIQSWLPFPVAWLHSCAFRFFSFRWPAAAMRGSTVFVSALSPLLAFIGLFTALAGLTTGFIFFGLIGSSVVRIYALHMISVSRPRMFPPASKRRFAEIVESKQHYLTFCLLSTTRESGSKQQALYKK